MIVGTVFDEASATQLRVTIVATGPRASRRQRGAAQAADRGRQKTGTDNQPVEGGLRRARAAGGDARERNRDATIEAMRQSGVEMLDIPAFLRKQAD